ncbi:MULTISPECIES: AMP-binding protein [unclassified Sphingomonas]|uniref:class I adenylate-forming enzyme family protein n=1 Tax=unclassified Sphingomonas TaxID=196159 RepID=UPI0025D8CD10|nr:MULTISPECIES: AMP-binding protein [unclassified Sphingomonas]
MQSVNDFLRYWATIRPNRDVAVCGDRRLGWGGLLRDSGAVAATLQGMGVSKGDRVGLMLDNSLEWVVAYLGILQAGAVLVPLNPRYGNFEVRAIEEDAECVVLISQASLGLALGDRFSVDGDGVLICPRNAVGQGCVTLEESLAAGGEPEYVRLTRGDLAAICYTSGTTGLPKGAMYAHGGIIDNVFAQALAQNLTSEERALIVAPLAFTGAVICILTLMLVLGGCSVIERSFEPERVLPIITGERITHLCGVPAIWERIARLDDFETADFSGMKLGLTGGAPVPAHLISLFLQRGLVIRQTYGCTEGGGMNAVTSLWAALERPHTCGEALISSGLMIAGPDGNAVPGNEIGEIWLRGPQTMIGYWRKPEATAEAFSGEWFKTGDLGRIDDRGQLIVVDRKKNMVISGGVNIYPAEIERAMSMIGGIIDVAVFGIKDAEWGEKVVAVVFLAPAAVLTDIEAEASRLLGSFKVPRSIVQSPTPLPRTATNKVSRQDLPAIYQQLTGQSIEALAASVA